MIELEELRKQLEPYNLSKVSRATGVDRSTLSRLMNEHSRPSYDTVKTLVDWLNGEDDPNANA